MRVAVRAVVAVASVCLGPWAGRAVADSLEFQGLPPYKNVRVLSIKADEIVFQTQSGTETHRPLARLVRITLDDDAAFTAAEQSYAAGAPEASIDNYAKVVRGTAKPWVKQRAADRLIETAGKAKRFDAAVTGYIALVSVDPALAAQRKPALPEAGSTYLATAAEQLRAAADDARLAAPQRVTLLGLLLDVQRARKDVAAVAATMEQVLKLGGTAGENPAAAAALASLKLDTATVALEQKDYKKAQDTIDQNRRLFAVPADQARALFLLAEARAGLMTPDADAAALKDSAVAYVRVVAVAKDLPGAPFVAESLMRVAALEERVNEPDRARTLYEAVARDYKGDPAAPKAKEAADRLRARPKG